MTHKQKALQHVREMNPELMELSFGCWVECDVMGRKTLLRIDNTEVSPNGYGITIDSDCYDFSKGEGKIIGHPVHLEHWLKGMGENYYIDSMGDVYKDTTDAPAPMVFTKVCSYDLTKDGGNQSKDFYKSYCKIIFNE